ncbi:galactokinase [Nannocystis bainbridge]|uniref:Galactokinase n=1 Tax=Nannocystis bainbridge TaxID=2995303 RepID=A0ABT5DQ78_9BACT|nr:galactokinase [Nannocystis bainbridge]MDC0715701.1 galactokinase [Nannocystis bainbridge]
MTERDAFTELFGRPSDLGASAPGRVNLIGDHTDYNGGYVLPTALPQRTYVQLALRPDRRVRATSAQRPGIREYELGAERRSGEWIDYVQAITATLAATDRSLSGFDLYVDSDVPVGGGLSSSAALEVALLRGLRRAFSLTYDDDLLAALAHRAETEFVGAPVGIMDPLVCSKGDEGSALFVDTRSRVVERIALPPDLGLVVIDSGVAHDHATGDYRTRRAECDRAAALLGVPQLRDVEAGDPRIDELPEPLRRRARHVVHENLRVLAATTALTGGDLPALGRIFDASHRSLRDDFEVSVPAIDLLVELAHRHPAVLGARITGGGFGGAMIILTNRASTAAVALDVVAAYSAMAPHAPMIVLPWLHRPANRPMNLES